MSQTLAKQHGAALTQKMLGEREGKHRNIDPMATDILIQFLHFCSITKDSKCSKFPVRSADLKQTWKYYLTPAVFNFYFHLSFLNSFPGKVHTLSISLLSFSFSELCGPQST